MNAYELPVLWARLTAQEQRAGLAAFRALVASVEPRIADLLDQCAVDYVSDTLAINPPNNETPQPA
jgi:hypothetical protein